MEFLVANPEIAVLVSLLSVVVGIFEWAVWLFLLARAHRVALNVWRRIARK